ncbi:MAG: hypothetical protein WCO89_00220 [Syntrophus sp. (in: bacteria)]
MKTEAELRARLKAELSNWFQRQCQMPYDDFHLYYLPTTPKHDGGILICSETPANHEYQLAMPQAIRKNYTEDQNFNWITHSVLRRLPVLEA